ncbi:unnamed protein product [Chondrus crispus]|uniref:Uncharacterized protein n=1 Tax=Chondrus crispus TaxID=2769 RepID=R7QP66_CHOCR|nr:unnamed protein product [Chondrus crispus]CDF39553.1 unnamed protein product [Chondrus crispus]|eukprot:XP_005709847.1 unnamed protein product [Chondrus crispus]
MVGGEDMAVSRARMSQQRKTVPAAVKHVCGFWYCTTVRPVCSTAILCPTARTAQSETRNSVSECATRLFENCIRFGVFGTSYRNGLTLFKDRAMSYRL